MVLQPASGFKSQRSTGHKLLRDVRIGPLLDQYSPNISIWSLLDLPSSIFEVERTPCGDYPVKLWGDRKLLKKEFNVLFSGCDSIGVWMVTSCSPEELRRWPPISCFHFETPSVHGCKEKTQELLAAFFHAEFFCWRSTIMTYHELSELEAWGWIVTCAKNMPWGNEWLP